MSKTLLLLGCFLSIGLITHAQDPHFSQHWITTMYTNPALTGNFNGSLKATALYRTQWGAANSAFNSLYGSYEHRLDIGFGPGDALGVGVLVASDKGGEVDFSNTSIQLAGAFHKGLGTFQHLTLGVQFGVIQQGIDPTKGRTAEQYDPVTGEFTLPSTDLFSNDGNMFTDLNVGLAYTGLINNDLRLRAGFAAHHLLNPKDKGFTDNFEGDALRMKLVGHLLIDKTFNNKFGLRARYLFMNQQKMSTEHFAGGDFFFNLADNNQFSVGAYYRIKDALVFHTSLEFGKIVFTMTYDLTTSKLTAANSGRGALELSALYRKKNFIKVKEMTVPAVRF